MKPLLSFLLLILFVTSCYNPSSSEIMLDLSSLEGEWESYKGVSFNENWRFESGNVFDGEGFSLNGADTSFFESLKIERVGDSVYYKVGLDDGSRGVDFLLTEASRNSWTFVNPENDFPSIINYEVEEDTILLVTISNIRGNKEQFFYLKRIR